MNQLWQRLAGLFRRGPQIFPDGSGYRVNGVYCPTQKAVREQLEQLQLPEGEIIRLLRELNRQKYGDPQR